MPADWQCRQTGSAGRLAVPADWQCRQTGSAGRLAVPADWQCRQTGSAGRLAVPADWQWPLALLLALALHWHCSYRSEGSDARHNAGITQDRRHYNSQTWCTHHHIKHCLLIDFLNSKQPKLVHLSVDKAMLFPCRLLS